MKKRIAEFIGLQVVKLVGTTLYFAGLTALIPLLPLFLSPEQLIGAKYAFSVAVGFILVGFLIVYGFSGSKKFAFRSLGFTTLLPGLLAVFFSYSGPRRMAAFLRFFGEFSPYLESFLETYVPKAWLLAGIYIILGVGLIWLSLRGEK